MKIFKFLALALILSPVNNALADKNDRTEPKKVYEFSYATEIQTPAAGEGPVDVFIPLAKTDDHQEVISKKIEANISGEVKTEAKNGNLFWHGHLDKSDGQPIKVSVNYSIVRYDYTKNIKNVQLPKKYSAEESKELATYLQADKLVPVSGELVEKILKDIKFTDASQVSQVRAIYDYVVDTMEYKKVGTGWGTGSTEWACSQKYGNCTDFHALFISLVRAKGIPAKFGIGFSIPTDKPEGDIAGYHCWAEFYLPKIGWVPVDASEAKKHPEMKELLFGSHPYDRVQFTTGRDLVLVPELATRPLNFLVYPYAEVKGVALAKDKFKNTFKYKTN
ncbi:MAG: transglutaminase domain-containing protein [Proteobacteria bacterium]|nr:transglutaminase domain-containing protein [Pseudomonadota bacterium]